MSDIFKVNEYIELRLENNKTNIYVNGKLFNQCKYLLLSLAPKDFEKYEDIDSIDEAFEVYNNDNDRKHEHDKTILDPKEEFIGHCSNIQAWVENDYDTRILMSNLSFPLLRAIANSGDKFAMIRLKEEIMLRLESREKNVILYILEEEWLDYFNQEELEMIYEKVEGIDEKIDSIILISFAEKGLEVPQTILKKMIRKLIISNDSQVVNTLQNIIKRSFNFLTYDELSEYFDLASDQRLLKQLNGLMTAKYIAEKQQEKIDKLKQAGQTSIKTFAMYD